MKLHFLFAAALLLGSAASAQAETPYDIVISGGLVIDPESGLHAVREIGVRNGSIEIVSDQPLTGKEHIDAGGLVVAPGFIDLHWHGKDPASYRYQVMDGVTASFELEVGTDDVDRWYAERAGKSLIHYGVAVGHIPVRMAVMRDPGDFLPAGDAARRSARPDELAAILRALEHGMQRGAVAMGFGVAYTPAAQQWELLEAFRVAARHGASAHVHIRGASSASAAGTDREQGLLEVIAASAVSGAGLHVVHIQSSGQGSTARMLRIIEEARANGLDVTTECYPYTAGATRIESFLFDDWDNRNDADYAKLQWVATGERLTRESFKRYRKQGGLVLIHANSEEVIRLAVAHPLTMIASDGFDVHDHAGHPRSAGTYARVLGRYVRDAGLLSLDTAIAKMTLMPAHRLERRVPSMRGKGRIKAGADADLTIFDPASVIDQATYEDPARFSQGIRFVLVAGVMTVRQGLIVDDVFPGRPIRAPLPIR